jgi:arginine/lysine/ornithine decarboxylase
MNTPIYDYLIKYAKTHPVRPHMPGHKGRPPFDLPYMESIYAMDITEIKGADSLFEANGIIAESEKNASSLFKTTATYYSCGGSTLCIQAMLFMMKQENRKVFAVRNVHKAFLNASALLDLDVEWIYPNDAKGILSGVVPLAELENKLAQCQVPCCVYLTSPDYLGNISDIKSISTICKKYKAKLIVDNAHGAHLAFTPINMHPIALGADMCCDSAHKMLPALTGTAYLHIASKEYVDKAKHAMNMFGSTSPSYLMLASLDLCNLYLEKNIRDDIKRMQKAINKLQNTLSEYFRFSFGDFLHITIYASESGTDGYTLAKYLEKDRILVEYVDKDIIILLFSPVTEQVEIRAVILALLNAAEKLNCRSSKIKKSDEIAPCRLEKRMSLRKAAISEYEEINVNDSLGRICAGVKVPCPPAVPVAVSGEVISRECIEVFNHYNIKTVYVVKENN